MFECFCLCLWAANLSNENENFTITVRSQFSADSLKWSHFPYINKSGYYYELRYLFLSKAAVKRAENTGIQKFSMMLLTTTPELLQNNWLIDQKSIHKLLWFCHLLSDRAENWQTGVIDDPDYESNIILTHRRIDQYGSIISNHLSIFVRLSQNRLKIGTRCFHDVDHNLQHSSVA